MHPILPYRTNSKLKFPLCRTCADTESKSKCECSEAQRCLTGVWCSPEVVQALNGGYIITRVHEIYHWEGTVVYDPDTKTGGLFAGYINTFLKFKQEASGWPVWCESDYAKKDGYIAHYASKEGINLTPGAIEKNPGLRSLAKLCLNSFWGKFGQRRDLKQNVFIHDSEADRFFRMMTDPAKRVSDFSIVSDDIIQLQWGYETGFQPESEQANVFIASFTTCWARLKLYSLLDQLGDRVLYYDTDSVIYVHRHGQPEPPLGDLLGQLTDELDGEHIIEYVSGGPKNYAYRTSSMKEVCKVQGFTLNFNNANIINFDTLKSMILGNLREVDVFNPRKICRDSRKRKIYNREERKRYHTVYTKRVVQEYTAVRVLIQTSLSIYMYLPTQHLRRTLSAPQL